ncbi:MAG TPA: hypothetical protein VE991_07910, partial [Acidimicrobiales bacterium]|nr:hypothetical protein [Acidimicrobiales bacterium]
EVGGSPAEPALSAADFHVAMAERQRLWPHSLNATSTHDSKRSEDMRCRLAVLSEMSGEWARAVGRWHRRFGPRLAGAGRQVAFDTELVVYQTVFGAWPLHDRRWEDFPDRIVRYVRKAAHEAKRETSWVRPDEAYEALLERFVRRLLGPDEPEFRREMARLVRRAAPAALANTLGLLALKVTAPGVPDFYQGAEDTLVALVDPDNRRPVDFDDLAVRLTRGAQWADAAPEERRAVVRELAAAGLAGDLKLFVTRQLLQSRRRQEELFAAGRYLPLATRGPGRDHVVAFARRRRRSWSVTVVPRCTVAVRGPGRPAVGDVWKSTSVVLPEGAPTSFRDVVTGTEIAARRGALAVRDLYAVLPVAVVLGDR